MKNKIRWTWTATITIALILLLYLAVFYVDMGPAMKRSTKSTKDLGKRPKAVIFALVKNEDYPDIVITLKSFEKTFNAKYNYPYVFLNDQPFNEIFIKSIQEVMTNSSNVTFGLVPTEHWSYPNWIDQKKAADVRIWYNQLGVLYGGRESYHHMCRFFSGFFYQHPLLQQYDYFWRLDPGGTFYCEMDYDPFVYMAKNKIEYGFLQMLPELIQTVPTLWGTTWSYLKEELPTFKETLEDFPVLKPLLLDDLSNNNEKLWNGCHFWSNFEIGHFGFFRSALYQSYFDYLDRAGGFYYERWGDAPVHTLAVALFLNYSQIHHFADVGYYHPLSGWCPGGKEARQRCTCDPGSKQNMARKGSIYGAGHCIFKLLADLKKHGPKN